MAETRAEDTRLGDATRAGARIRYHLHGTGETRVILLPTWEIIDSRGWQRQVPVLDDHATVITFDAVGTGASDRPRESGRYTESHRMADALAVLDATGTERAVVVGYSASGGTALNLAARHPERVDALLTIGANHPWMVDPDVDVESAPYDPETGTPPKGWGAFDPAYWHADWPGFVDWFMHEVCSDPGADEDVADLISWALEQDPQIAEWTVRDAADLDATDTERGLRALDTPTTLMHGTSDRIVGFHSSEILRDMIPGARVVPVEGAGHAPQLTRAGEVNAAILDLVARVAPAPHAR